MRRTRIHLTDEEFELLDRESKATGTSRSALIRRAVRATYGGQRSRPALTCVGVVSNGSLDAERIDDALAEIYDEKHRTER